MHRDTSQARSELRAPLASAVALVVGAASLAGCAGHGAHTSEGLAIAQERMATIKAATQWDMARQQFLTGDLEKALASVNRSLEVNASIAKSHSLKGRILIELGQLEQALRSLQQARAIDPQFEEAHYFLGVVYERFSEYELALESYKRAAALAPDDPQYAVAAAEMLVELGALEEAEALLRTSSSGFQHNAGVKQTLGHIALLRDQPERAVKYFSQAHLLAPDDPATLEDLVVAQMEAERYADAERSLSRLRDEPDYADRGDMKRLHARALMELDEPVKARTLLLELTRDAAHAGDAQVWIDLASAALLIDDWRRVRHAAAKAVALAPDRYEGHMHLAAWARHRGDARAALENLDRAIALAKHDATPLLMKGLVLQDLGRRDEAAQVYAQAAQLQRQAGLRSLASVEEDNN